MIFIFILSFKIKIFPKHNCFYCRDVLNNFYREIMFNESRMILINSIINLFSLSCSFSNMYCSHGTELYSQNVITRKRNNTYIKK